MWVFDPKGTHTIAEVFGPRFVIDVKAANKPAKPITFHGYVNGKKAKRRKVK
jgi:hypothetical protein